MRDHALVNTHLSRTCMRIGMAQDYAKLPLSHRAFLALESQRMMHALSFDPMLAMRISGVDSLPHQIEAVYEHALKKPRIRFMFAHDPGAGKTIMAGLVLRDLELRGVIRRILVVVPGQLREQWKWELKQRFGMDFTIIDREAFSEKGGRDAWGGGHLITSIDFAKRNDVLRSLAGVKFDMVVVDEAHKMSAYSYGRTTSKTKRYHLGEVLSVSSKHMLFLTATPHKGDAQNFRLLLDLLEPGFFSKAGMIEESVGEKNNPIFLRRVKEDMINFDGTPMFVPRTVHTPDVPLSDTEKSLYENMSKYVAEQYNLATRSVKGHNIAFALIILQRRFASSLYALVKSLKRRLAKLEQLERSAEGISPDDLVSDSMENVDEMSEKERWEEEQKWELISAAQNMEELRDEIGIIASLIQQAEEIVGSESKLSQLKKTLEELDRTYPDEKMLIFTESKDTLDYLVQHVCSWGYTANTIHGSMSAHDRREAEDVFRNETRIMVATEAAGEGINLQFCRLMVNYDLPWNPNRLEQRMGRIHRYGQKLPVFIFNLVAADTREGEILIRLFEKLEDIKAIMGSDKIFDVISDIVPGKSLSQLLLDATVRSRKQTRIISDLDAIIGDPELVKDQMQDRFTSQRIDSLKLETLKQAVVETSLVPEYARRLFCDIVSAAGGNVRDGGTEGRTAHVRIPARIHADSNGNAPQDVLAVFDTGARAEFPDSELVTFGHPAFDASLQWAVSQFAADAGRIATARDPTGRLDGYLMFFTGNVLYSTGEHVASHMVACAVGPDSGQASPISPSVILDLDWNDYGADNGVQHDDAAPAAPALEAALEAATLEMQSHAERVAVHGRIQAKMAQKYGLRSLDSLLDQIEADIIKLLEKKIRGIKTDLAIHNKRKDRTKYRTARFDLERRIESDVNLEIGKISPIGIVRVVPDPAVDARDKMSAVAIAENMENKRGRVPENLHGKHLGFDIRSTGTDGIKHKTRYILAIWNPKGKWVDFTANEWLKARMLQDSFYLYVVHDGKPAVTFVSDPAHTLNSVRHGFMHRVSAEHILAYALPLD